MQFRRITWETALQLRSQISAYYARVKDVVSGMLSISDIASEQNLHSERLDDHPGSSILHIRTQEGGEASQVIYRQVCRHIMRSIRLVQIRIVYRPAIVQY